MSSEALAVVRTVLDRFAARDFVGAAVFLDRDVVWFGTRGGLDEERVLRGQEACIAYMREIVAPWQWFGVEIERLIDVDDTVVAFMRETAGAQHADLELHNATAIIFGVAGQKIVHLRGYLDREEALEAARKTH